MAYILFKKTKKVTDKNTSYLQIASNYFKPNFKVDYRFQHYYRSKDISFYFKKEFISAVILLIVYQTCLNDIKDGLAGKLTYFTPIMQNVIDPITKVA